MKTVSKEVTKSSPKTKASTATEKPPAVKAEPSVINLTRIKQWYVVADIDSYLRLKQLGAPMIRFHQNFLPTLHLLTKSNKVKIQGLDFNQSILDPFFEKTASTWVKKYGKCTITSKVLVFQADGDKVPGAKEAVSKLETLLQTFFQRWGYKFQFSYSESRGGTKMKFHVEYWFDSEKMPILQMETPVEEMTKVQFKVGFTRLTFSFDDPVKVANSKQIGYVHLLIEISQGGKFTPFHSSKCLYSQLSSVKPLLLALMNVLNVDQHNLDNPAD